MNEINLVQISLATFAMLREKGRKCPPQGLPINPCRLHETDNINAAFSILAITVSTILYCNNGVSPTFSLHHFGLKAKTRNHL